MTKHVDKDATQSGADPSEFDRQLAIAREVMTRRRSALADLSDVATAQLEMGRRIIRENHDILRALAQTDSCERANGKDERDARDPG